MMLKLALLLSLCAAGQPKYEDVAPWLFRKLNKELSGKHIRVREIVGKVGVSNWSLQLTLKKFKQKDWLMITSRKGWSHCFYLVSAYDAKVLAAAHRLEPGDKCTFYGQVVGVPSRVSGNACVVVAKIEAGWPDDQPPPRKDKATIIKEAKTDDSAP